jgi:hypothetical protein
MGGYGSGRSSGLPTVEECYRIEFPALKKHRYLDGHGRSGSWAWSRNGEHSGSIGLRTVLDGDGTGRLILDYAKGGVTKHQVIYLDAAPMGFGGVRWWALCPIMGRRCGTLVMSGRYDGFVSVKASGYAYGSQTEDDVDRLRRRRDKAEARYKALSKYARQPTKTHLWNVFLNADDHYEEAFEVMAAHLYGRIAKYDALSGIPKWKK